MFYHSSSPILDDCFPKCKSQAQALPLMVNVQQGVLFWMRKLLLLTRLLFLFSEKKQAYSLLPAVGVYEIEGNCQDL